MVVFNSAQHISDSSFFMLFKLRSLRVRYILNGQKIYLFNFGQQIIVPTLAHIYSIVPPVSERGLRSNYELEKYSRSLSDSIIRTDGPSTVIGERIFHKIFKSVMKSLQDRNGRRI